MRPFQRTSFSELAKSFPFDDFCSEESTEPLNRSHQFGEFAWVLDPVDGTNNYAVGVPECGISLGLLRNGIPVYGFIYIYEKTTSCREARNLDPSRNHSSSSQQFGLVNENSPSACTFPFQPKNWMHFVKSRKNGVFAAPIPQQLDLQMGYLSTGWLP